MKKKWIVGSVMALVIVVALGSWIVARQNSPRQAFNDMLTNNLATPSVTRVVKQGNENLNVAQYTQLQLGARPVTHALTVFMQHGGLIVTEEISDRKDDFVRYQNIIATTKTDSGKSIDTSSVVGKWAKLDASGNLGSTVTSGLFDQTLLGVLPIANLQPDKRHELLQFIADNHVFSYDAHKVKTVTINERKAYSYAVSIKPAPYITMMQQFGHLLGLNQYATVDANAYSKTADIVITVAVDARSHTLAEVVQPDSNRTETYEAFGTMNQTKLPKTTLTTRQLTELLGRLR